MRTLLVALVVFANFAGGSAPSGGGDYAVTMNRILGSAESLARFATGLGVGLVAWMGTLHQGASFLLSRVPRSWRLWHRGVFTSRIPFFKYLLGGLLLLVVGAGLVYQLVGLNVGALEAGLWAGAMTGFAWTVRGLARGTRQIDLLLSNRRHVDESKVRLSLSKEN